MQFAAKRRWRLIILGTALVLILASRSLLYANFVQPIALFLWAAWRVMASVNQSVYWTLLLLVGLLPLIWMTFSRRETVARSAYHQEPLPPSRVEHWQHLLAGANGSQKDRERLHDEWDRLLQSVEAKPGPSDTNDLDRDDHGQAGSLLPASDQAHNTAPGRGHAPQVPGSLRWLPESVQRRLTRFTKTNDRWILESLSWMESELDIAHGNQDN